MCRECFDRLFLCLQTCLCLHDPFFLSSHIPRRDVWLLQWPYSISHAPSELHLQTLEFFPGFFLSWPNIFHLKKKVKQSVPLSICFCYYLLYSSSKLNLLSFRHLLHLLPYRTFTVLPLKIIPSNWLVTSVGPNPMASFQNSFYCISLSWNTPALASFETL